MGESQIYDVTVRVEVPVGTDEEDILTCIVNALEQEPGLILMVPMTVKQSGLARMVALNCGGVA